MRFIWKKINIFLIIRKGHGWWNTQNIVKKCNADFCITGKSLDTEALYT